MKRFLISLTAGALALGGCGSTGGAGEPRPVWHSAPSSTTAAPSPSVSVDVAGCAMARTLNAASALGDFAAVGVELSKAQDGPLAEAAIRLAVEAARPSASRTAVYGAYLDVLAECLRVSP